MLLWPQTRITGSRTISGSHLLTIAPEDLAAPPAGVTIEQLTSSAELPTACAIAYYDTPAWSASRSQLVVGCGEGIGSPPFSSFDWKAWTMNLDGTGATQLSTKRINDPWGWTPDGDKIYFRSAGMAIMDPDTGLWEVKIADVVSGNLCKVGANLFAIYEVPAVDNTIGVWRSTDGGDTFSVYASYEMDDPYPTYSFHRLRSSCVDLDADGDPDLFYYKKSCGNGCGSFTFNANTGVSTQFTFSGDTVPELNHPDVFPSAATVYGGWLVAGGGSPGIGYIYPFNLQTGVAGTALNLGQWSNWTYRSGSTGVATGQLAMSKSTIPRDIGLYTIATNTLEFSYKWTNPVGCTYWCEIAPQMVSTNVFIMRAPDSDGMTQIWKVTYSP